MTTPRNYNCKDEELTVICEYSLISLQRDKADFAAYSPKFNEEYITGYKAKIDAAIEMVNPTTETKDLKVITARLYATMDSLNDMLNRLEGYIKMAKTDIPISVADFGISLLKKKINHRDAEGVLQNLHIVSSNIQKYQLPLSAQGLSTELIEQFTAVHTAIDSDNQKQYEIITNRKALVENNVTLLNSLYEQLIEICEIGKILYKKSNPVKVTEYTFNDLKKKVRITPKNDKGKTK